MTAAVSSSDIESKKEKATKQTAQEKRKKFKKAKRKSLDAAERHSKAQRRGGPEIDFPP